MFRLAYEAARRLSARSGASGQFSMLKKRAGATSSLIRGARVGFGARTPFMSRYGAIVHSNVFGTPPSRGFFGGYQSNKTLISSLGVLGGIVLVGGYFVTRTTNPYRHGFLEELSTDLKMTTLGQRLFRGEGAPEPGKSLVEMATL